MQSSKQEIFQIKSQFIKCLVTLVTRLEFSHRLLWKVKRDLYLRNRPTLKLKQNANRNLFLRKMLLVGHEKVTEIDLPQSLPENAFRINSSGSIALTYARIWSKKSNSSGGVSKLFLPGHSSIGLISYWKPILRLQLSAARIPISSRNFFWWGRESYLSTPLGVQPLTIAHKCGDSI